MNTNYVLIDFENVQPESLQLLTQEHFKVVVFVGASQNCLPFALADSMQQLGCRAQYVKISGNGRNALDFHIAYYIGRLVTIEPTARFHVIAKDTGYDPLIDHLRSQKIPAWRVTSVIDIPSVKAANATSVDERISLVIDKLHRMKDAKPRNKKTLSSTIGAVFLKQILPDEVEALIQIMVSRGHLKLTDSDQSVSYSLPTAV